MTERGKRFNEGKRRWSLIDHRVLEPLVDVMQKGSEKYGDKNYQLGMPIVEIMDSLQRHLVEFRDHGNDHDEESKMHHCAHILSNAYILMYNILFHPDMDNRVKADDFYGVYRDSKVEELKAWMKSNKIKDPVEFIKREMPGLIQSRGQEYVDRVFEESGGILKGISPEQFINQERQNARVRRNS
jgi:hypothetical protein